MPIYQNWSYLCRSYTVYEPVGLLPFLGKGGLVWVWQWGEVVMVVIVVMHVNGKTTDM